MYLRIDKERIFRSHQTCDINMHNNLITKADAHIGNNTAWVSYVWVNKKLYCPKMYLVGSLFIYIYIYMFGCLLLGQWWKQKYCLLSSQIK